MMWGFGWGWAGAVFMVICIVMMVRMMGHGDHGDHGDHGPDGGRFTTHGGIDAPERTLANRLARGEIDVDEYQRLREILRDSDGTSGT
jgi:uncharacterized membrane protein